MEKLDLQIHSIDGNEIVIREGEALPQHEPERIKLRGDISAVTSFIRGRVFDGDGPQDIDTNKAIVTVDKTAGGILLQLDPENYYGAEVLAILEISDELAQFRINDKKLLSQNEVVEILKFNRIFFADAERHAALLSAYKSFSYQANTAGHNSSDDRGNRAKSFTKNVTTGLPEDFVLSIPIFKGQPKKTFRVEICLDVTDGSCKFWFDSVELHEITEIEKERIFDEELKVCEGLVIINK